MTNEPEPNTRPLPQPSELAERLVAEISYLGTAGVYYTRLGVKRLKAVLADAADQLAKLKRLNEDSANGRLDKAKLDELATEQRKLAEDAKKADADKRAELADKQHELNERLAKLRAESDALKKASAVSCV